MFNPNLYTYISTHNYVEHKVDIIVQTMSYK